MCSRLGACEILIGSDDDGFNNLPGSALLQQAHIATDAATLTRPVEEAMVETLDHVLVGFRAGQNCRGRGGPGHAVVNGLDPALGPAIGGAMKQIPVYPGHEPAGCVAIV